MEDYYKILGLKRGANSKEISAAYRSQALIHHPDKRQKSPDASATDNDHFHKIKTAYQALQDPKIRAELDLQLIGQEERLKRDAQMSAQRKQFRDELLNREKEAAGSGFKGDETAKKQRPVELGKKEYNVINVDSCLLLKYRIPPSILANPFNSTDSLNPETIEMIKTVLGGPCSSLLFIHENQKDPSSREIVAEFKDPQEAYKALCKLPSDMIIKAGWFQGYPPDSLNVSFMKSPIATAATSTPVKPKVKYSKELENSVLERLKQKKLQSQKDQKIE